MFASKTASRDVISSRGAFSSASATVQAFIDGKIGYTDIAKTVEKCLATVPNRKCETIDDVLAAVEETKGKLG